MFDALQSCIVKRTVFPEGVPVTCKISVPSWTAVVIFLQENANLEGLVVRGVCFGACCVGLKRGRLCLAGSGPFPGCSAAKCSMTSPRQHVHGSGATFKGGERKAKVSGIGHK